MGTQDAVRAVKRPKLLAIMLVTGAFCVATAFLLVQRGYAQALATLLFAMCLALFCEYMTADVFFCKNRTWLSGKAPLVALLITIGGCFVASLLFEVGTLIGAHTASPFNVGDWSIKRVVSFAFAAYAITLFRLWYWDGRRPFGDLIRDLCDTARSIGSAWLLAAVLMIACVIGGVIVAGVGGYSMAPTLGFFAAAGVSASAIVVLWK